MDILSITQIIFGVLITLFIPGFLFTLLFFYHVNALEKLLFSVIFSIMISIGVAIYLGYSQDWAAITGGLNLNNSIRIYTYIFAVLLVSAAFRVGIIQLQNRKKKKSGKD